MKLNPAIDALKVKIFADGADLEGMVEMAAQPYIAGLTTNPTLMRKAGVKNYTAFAREVLAEIKTKPVSFEVFSDELEEMKLQGEQIAAWAENVFVKIPVTNTKGISTASVVGYLSGQGVKLNVTAIMTQSQVSEMVENLNPGISNYLSVFAGRIADTGRDPMPIMQECAQLISTNAKSELIWASPRELLNVFQADAVGCHIITASNDILKKLEFVGKELTEYSRETVEMFFIDALNSQFKI